MKIQAKQGGMNSRLYVKDIPATIAKGQGIQSCLLLQAGVLIVSLIFPLVRNTNGKRGFY